ncbi:hypothetical protein KFK09_000302 [Dendrobium nobile]|uniref:Retrovirus-related Pol polyprotein from transposon TNT 1-94 n=1 Tax=Dendrobium nobile TaxID=94219 RepID=A0A8T3C862_DENNO|nr:hypothetical protein KFK09_000302 [Dendrobium nobile]
MANQGASSQMQSASSQPLNPSPLSATMANFTVPPPLKFLLSKLKLLVHNQLTVDNYALWRLQIHQAFSANGFEGYISGQLQCPDSASDQKLWKLIDQNLISALFSTISPSILPNILHLKTSHDIWKTLELHPQPSNRSCVIQLKNELHNVQMRDQTISQYLSQIKSLVDNIAAAGSHIDIEDIIPYTLKGLPPSYNPFKASIRTSPHTITLESLYSYVVKRSIFHLSYSKRPHYLATFRHSTPHAVAATLPLLRTTEAVELPQTLSAHHTKLHHHQP